MRDSRISLPPLVEGPVRGALRLSLGALSWAETAPAHLQQHDSNVVARAAWWGDASGGDLVTLPPPAAAAAACLSFQLRTGPKYLTRYLRDMGALTITIESAPSSSGGSSSVAAAPDAGEAAAEQPLAAATVGLLSLDVQAPISGTYPLVQLTAGTDAAAAEGSSDPAGAAAIVGSLDVRLELDYSSASGAAALVSSFEMNEHLASSAAGSDEEAGADTDSDADGSSGGDAGAAAEPAGLCEQLLAALKDSELVATAVQQLARGGAAADEAAPVLDGLQMSPAEVAHRLLPLLLPAATEPQLQYLAAMLQPFTSCSGRSSSESDGQPSTTVSLDQLAAAAAECAAVERELASQPPAEALQALRQAAAALASRSLDLAAAFAAADGQQLPLGQLGALLQRLYPGAAADDARRLLALVAASSNGGSTVTLPDLKAALAQVQEAQQFPTEEDLARQQAAVEARRAKEAAAAAVAAMEQQRAAAAAAAKVPPSQRKQAVVSKLKSSLQERRRSSTSGSSMQAEAHASAAPAEQPTQQPVAPEPPAVVLGIPVLQPPPPTAELLASLPVQPAAAMALRAPAAMPVAADNGLCTPGTAADSQLLAALEAHATRALCIEQLQPGQPPPPPPPPQEQQQLQQPQQEDALLNLIQQAEALKAAMQQASSSSDAPIALPARSQLWEAATASAAAPWLPNLLLPPANPGGGGVSAAAGAADSSSLSAATAALLAAAQALRLESEQLPLPGPPAGAFSDTAVSATAAPAALPAAQLAAGPAATRANLVAAAVDSDAESDAEDALLDQLFFQRTQRPAELACSATSACTADGASPQPAAKPLPEPEVQLVLRVQLGPPQLEGPSERSSSVRCVIKPLQAGGAAQQLNVPVASAAGPAPVSVELPVSGGVGSDGRLPLLPPYLFLELWWHSGDLLGVSRVPLLQPPAAAGVAAQGGFPAAVVAEGRQPISDILEGRDAGSLHVAAVLQERGAAPLVAALRHCFSVAIRSAHRLPSAAAYAGAGLRAPDARVLCYSFPGEPDALQTQEVPCCSSPSFDATATHEMTLRAGHSIVPLLQEGLLRFELYDCWADQQQRQQHGWALLQLRELASLAAEAKSSSTCSAAREASRVVLLPLCTEYESAGEAAGAAGGGEAAARGPSLKIELTYKAQLCTMHAAEVAAASPATASVEELRTSSSPSKQPLPAGAKPVAGGSSSSDSDGENSLLLANCGSGRQAQHAAQARPVVAAANAVAAAQLPARSIPAEPFVPATLSVEIIRASGLGAAVREAAAAAGGGAGTSLGRAAVVGPHAFVRLALFPHGDAALQSEAPPLQTAFVPQSFCPAWRSVHSYPLQLTAGMVQALASQSMRVEVWHRCPRATAGSGDSSRGAREVLLGAGAVPLVDVLRKTQGLRCWVPLTPGSGSDSSAGVVGAVQVAACLTSLGSLTGGPAEGEPLLLRCTEAAALVPAPLRPRLLLPPGSGFSGQLAVLAVHLDTLVPPSSSSLSGGRPKADRFFCRYSLPGANGSSTATASRVLSCAGSGVPAASSRKGGVRGAAAGSSAAEQQQQQRWAAKLNHAGFFEVTADASLAAALLHGPLLVHVYKQPAGAASEAGRSAVLVGTAEVDLSALLWADSGSSGSSAGHEAGSQLRTISGTYPLLEGAAAAQGGASLAARVQLQLQPEAGATQQAAAAAAAGAHTAALEQQQPAKELPAPAVDSAVPGLRQPEKQQQQQHLVEASASSSDDDDDDEAHEELLRRCQRLTAALRIVCPDEAAADGLAIDAGGCRGEAGGEQPAAGSGDGQQQAEQQAAEGALAAASTAVSSGLPQQQQGAALVRQGGSSPSAAVVQQDQPQGPDEPEDAPKLLLQIDSALHLPTEVPSTSGSDGYAAFVSASWGPHQQRTAAVPVHVVAAAELGGTAVWHAELELPAAAAAWHSQPGSSGSSGGGPNLVLNVWVAPDGTGSSSSCSSNSAQPASVADSLLGCCVLDLRALPALHQLAGYWHIVDSQQRQQGQLKASVHANGALREALQLQRGRLGQASDAAPGGVAAQAGTPHSAAAGVPQLPEQPGAAAVTEGEQPEQPADAGGDLAQQVQAQLQELQLLSQRLAGQPPSAYTAAAAASGAAQQPAQQAGRSPASGAAAGACAAPAAPAAADADTDGQVAAMLAAAGPLQADVEVVKPVDNLPASDEEWDGSALPPNLRQEGMFAWSGSDSDDGMGLVGIAVDGAISGEVTEEEEEEHERPRAPARLLAQDWMFAISKTDEAPEVQLAAQHAAGQPEQQQQRRPAQQRPAVRFRNVIPGGALGGAAGKEPTAPAAHLEELAQQQREEEEEQAAHALLQHRSTSDAAAAAAAARSAQAVEAAQAAAAQGPTLHQFEAQPAAAAAARPAPVQLQQPLPRRQQLAGGLQPGWQFDICKEPQPPVPAASFGQAAWSQQLGSTATAATPSSVRVDQFGVQQPSGVPADTPASAATPASLLAQQRSELQQRSQQVRSPAAAATIDEVLAQLRRRQP